MGLGDGRWRAGGCIPALIPDESGATMVEYAMMVGLIAAVVASAVAMVGSGTNDRYQQVLLELDGH